MTLAGVDGGASGTVIRRRFTIVEEGTFGAPATRGLDVRKGVVNGCSAGLAGAAVGYVPSQVERAWIVDGVTSFVGGRRSSARQSDLGVGRFRPLKRTLRTPKRNGAMFTRPWIE